MATISIFISSVQKELAEERRAMKAFVEGDALLRRFFTAFLFEDLPAADRRADEVYLDEVDRCAIYVGLFGNDYGYEDKDGVAPTEREFDRATLRAKPRLIFVKGTDDKVRHPKMRTLVRKAGDQLIRRRFATPTELTKALYASLVDFLEDRGVIQNRPFDERPCIDATLDDIDAAVVVHFVRRARFERQFPLPEGTATADVLAHLNLIREGRPTHAATLLFGGDPQRFIPAPKSAACISMAPISNGRCPFTACSKETCSSRWIKRKISSSRLSIAASVLATRALRRLSHSRFRLPWFGRRSSMRLPTAITPRQRPRGVLRNGR